MAQIQGGCGCGIGLSCSSNLTPNLGTSICHRCVLRKKKENSFSSGRVSVPHLEGETWRLLGGVDRGRLSAVISLCACVGAFGETGIPPVCLRLPPLLCLLHPPTPSWYPGKFSHFRGLCSAILLQLTLLGLRRFLSQSGRWEPNLLTLYTVLPDGGGGGGGSGMDDRWRGRECAPQACPSPGGTTCSEARPRDFWENPRAEDG